MRHRESVKLERPIKGTRLGVGIREKRCEKRVGGAEHTRSPGDDETPAGRRVQTCALMRQSEVCVCLSGLIGFCSWFVWFLESGGNLEGMDVGRCRCRLDQLLFLCPVFSSCTPSSEE